MKYTKLQKAGLNISRLGLGTKCRGDIIYMLMWNEEEGKAISRRSFS